jgi:hypothetical protein
LRPCVQRTSTATLPFASVPPWIRARCAWHPFAAPNTGSCLNDFRHSSSWNRSGLLANPDLMPFTRPTHRKQSRPRSRNSLDVGFDDIFMYKVVRNLDRVIQLCIYPVQTVITTYCHGLGCPPRALPGRVNGVHACCNLLGLPRVAYRQRAMNGTTRVHRALLVVCRYLGRLCNSGGRRCPSHCCWTQSRLYT